MQGGINKALELQGEDVEDAEKYDELIEQMMTSIIGTKEKEEKAEEISEIASNWWSEKIKNPSRNADLGEDLQPLVSSIMNMMPKTEENKVPIFIDALKAMIKGDLLDSGFADLYVDYGPQGILLYAAKQAKLVPMNYREDDPTTIFPWKTHMDVSLNKITVSEGYGPKEVLFDRNNSRTFK